MAITGPSTSQVFYKCLQNGIRISWNIWFSPIYIGNQRQMAQNHEIEDPTEGFISIYNQAKKEERCWLPNGKEKEKQMRYLPVRCPEHQ